jgi:hypothetical protein
MTALRRPAALAASVVAATSIFMSLPALPALAAVPLPVIVTAGAMPTPQTDGIVWSVAIVGNTVYVGGRFSKARPAGVAPGGAGEVTRNNLMAFNLTTGAILPWAPAVSGSGVLTKDPGPFCRSLSATTWTCDSVFRIKASPDGKQIYVVGDYDKIDNQWRSRIARFDAATGAMDPAFHPQIAGRVRGVSVTNDTVYVGGGFNAVNGVGRTRLAALDLAGNLKPWAPTADGEVYAVTAAPQQGRVMVGGDFNRINGEARRAMMAVDATSGANVAWQAKAPDSVYDTVTDIVTDGNGTAYMGSYNYGGSVRWEGRAAFDIATGQAKWWDGCYGDTQSVAVANGVVYSASHTHDCSAMNAAPDSGPIGYYRLVAETKDATGTATQNVNHVHVGDPIPTMLPWFPNTNGGPDSSYWKNGPWAVDTNGQYVVVGGEFTTVNGVAQQSLTRFAARGVSGAVNNGPQQSLMKAPSLSREFGAAGSPVITWNATWDAQNSDVTYMVYRDGTTDPIYTVTQTSRPWDTPQLKFIDRTANAGTYRIKATDADGATVSSPRASIG